MSEKLLCPECGTENKKLEDKCSKCNYKYKETVLKYYRGEKIEKESLSFVVLPEVTDDKTKESLSKHDSSLLENTGSRLFQKSKEERKRTRKILWYAFIIFIVIAIGMIVYFSLWNLEL